MSARWVARAMTVACLLFAGRASADVEFAAKVEGGPSYRSIQRTTIIGSDLRLGLGGRGRNVAGYAILGGTFGETAFGLTTRSFATGPCAEAILGRFRIGAEILFSYLTYTRATTRAVVPSMGVVGHFFATFDLFATEGHGFYLGVDVQGGAIGGAGIVGTTGLAGFRY